MKILPFNLTLSGLTLKGKEREKAKIIYEIKDEESRERELLLIDYDTDELRKLPECKIKKLDIDKKYNRIDNYTYDIETAKIRNENKSEEERKLDELEIKLKYEKINGIEYCKQKNDILGKPWVAIKTNYDEEANPDNMEVEVVYNKTFIEYMRNRGLPGDTDEEIAGQWLKLFFIANLEDDDIKLMLEENDEEEQNFQRTSKRVITNAGTIIG